MNQKTYAGNDKPFVYAQFAPQDRADAAEILSVMQERGYALWPSETDDKRRMKKSALALFFLSPAAAKDEALNSAVTRAAQTNHPMLIVYLSPTELTPAQRLLLNTQQAVERRDDVSDATFFEKLFGSSVLQNLQVTSAQKRAARLTIAGIAGGVLAAAVLAVALTLSTNAVIPEDSLLGQYGFSGRMTDIRQIYIYGSDTRHTRGENTFGGTVYDWQAKSWHDMIFYDDANEESERGSLADLSDFGQLKNLEELSLAGNQIADISPLSGLKKLRFLDLAGNPVSDLRGIESLDALEELNIAGTRITSLQPLDGCNNLAKVFVDTAQYAAFSSGDDTHAYELVMIGPMQDLLHLDTYIVGGADDPGEPKRPYMVFLRTLSWTIYSECSYEFYQNGSPVRIDRVQETTIFPGRANDEIDLWLNPDDFGRYDANAEYLLVLRYHDASATFRIYHQNDDTREDPMCPELIATDGF